MYIVQSVVVCLEVLRYKKSLFILCYLVGQGSCKLTKH